MEQVSAEQIIDTPVAYTALPIPAPGWLDRIREFDLAFHRSLQTAFQLQGFLPMALKIFVRIGDGYLWIAASIYLLFWQTGARSMGILSHCLLTAGISLALYWTIKLTFRRLRPYEQFSGVEAQIPPLDRFSFPSGHTMNNLSIALAFAYHFPSLLFVAALLPPVWGVLRVYFGVHFISDIAGGVAFGFLSFLLGLWLFPLFLI